MKQILFSTRFVAALGLIFLVIGATPSIAAATGTIGCNQVVQTKND